MHPTDILARLDALNVEVSIHRHPEPYFPADKRWITRLTLKRDGTELSCRAEEGSHDEALAAAWAQADRWLSTVPGRQAFQPVLTHIDDEIPY